MEKANKNTNEVNFDSTEYKLSQKPALELLSKLGWEILDYEQANILRGKKLSSVLLEDILYKQLSEINKISFQGKEYAFEQSCIQSAVQKLKPFKNDGLLPLNNELTDLLIMGTSETQSINGSTKSFTLNYIDWNNPDKNVFHAVPEFVVERVRSEKTARPDIVLFVNGIPLGVIECKAPSEDLEQGITQNIRNQTETYIPHLFMYCQILLAVNKNGAKYATVGTQSKFWNIWKEPDISPLLKIIENPTEQDKTIFSLCSKERFLDLIHGFTVFDVGTKKIARYQQYFSIKATLERIHCIGNDGIRQGGIIWHTQGSGKSLTMVMLAKNLMYCKDIPAPRIILVTDRTDLDEQLGDTFKHCGITPVRATSGKNLLDLISEKKASVITTLIHKFDKAAGIRNFHDDSSNIFVLVDESHRTQFGSFAAKMRQVFPKACYIGFTGTPLLKKEKNNFQRFGGLIKPTYTIAQAVADKAVVPLLYEGRLVELTQNKEAIDLWFERHTSNLTEEQKADLKKKYARADMLQKTEQVIYMRAFDINEHYKNNWQGTGFKGQLVAADKKTAVKFKQFFDEFGDITTEVLISGVDTRDSYTDILEEPSEIVDAFWKKMMAKYKDEKEYNEKIIDAFKHGDEPEIIIVVDKLLTGFDAPCNTVLYLCRPLKEHTLLQAIARVNRLCDGKDFGYIIDYADVLENLDKALTTYQALADFDQEDLDGALSSVSSEINTLPQKYSALIDIFNPVKASYDENAYEEFLADDDLRQDFYDRLRDYAKTLAIALSSEIFLADTELKDIERYKNTLKRFEKLRKAVQYRYAEVIDYRDYEPKIQKLLDTHIHADTVTKLNEPTYIIHENTGLYNVAEDSPGKGIAAYADRIASIAKKTISENMEEDPAFYTKFSVLIQNVIDAYRQKQISDLEYLKQITETKRKLDAREHDEVPENLVNNDNAIAAYGVIHPIVSELKLSDDIVKEISSNIAFAFDKILDSNSKVNFWNDEDAINNVKDLMDDYFYDVIRDEKGISIPSNIMDQIIEKVLFVERKRRNH